MGCGASQRYRVAIDDPITQEPEQNGHRRNSKMTPHEKQLIESTLRSSCICSSCNQGDIEELSKDVVHLKFSADDVVCKKNDSGTHFFIVQGGTFQEVMDEDRKQVKGSRAMERGSCFGELALIQDCKHKATVVCIAAGGIWAVDGKTFRKVLNQLSSRHADEHRNHLSRVSLFSGLSEDQLDLLANCRHVRTYKKGTYIVKEGDPGEGVFIVKDGELKVSAKGKEVRRLLHGHYFGERALLDKGDMQKFTVVTLSPTTCLSIGRQQLQEVLRIETLERLIFDNFIATALNEAFQQLTRKQIEGLTHAMEQREYDTGVAVHAGEEGEPRDFDRVRFFVVLEGIVDVIPPELGSGGPERGSSPKSSVDVGRRATTVSQNSVSTSSTSGRRRPSLTAGRLHSGDCYQVLHRQGCLCSGGSHVQCMW